MTWLNLITYRTFDNFFFLAEGKVEIENKFLEAAFAKFLRAFSIVFKTRFRHEINYFYLPKEFLSLSSPISNLLKKVKRFVFRDQKKKKSLMSDRKLWGIFAILFSMLTIIRIFHHLFITDDVDVIQGQKHFFVDIID